MSDQGKRWRRGYLYTPFGGSQALDSAMGENMARLANNKAPPITRWRTSWSNCGRKR